MKSSLLFVAGLAFASTTAFAAPAFSILPKDTTAPAAPAAAAPAAPAQAADPNAPQAPSTAETAFKCINDGVQKSQAITDKILKGNAGKDKTGAAIPNEYEDFANMLKLPAPAETADEAKAMSEWTSILGACLETAIPLKTLEAAMAAGQPAQGQPAPQVLQDAQEFIDLVNGAVQSLGANQFVFSATVGAAPYIADNVKSGVLKSVDDPALKDLEDVGYGVFYGPAFTLKQVVFVLNSFFGLQAAPAQTTWPTYLKDIYNQ